MKLLEKKENNMETIETTNLYYFHSILEIGGIETFFYYLAKKYKD
jgi:hypothetical protein